MIDLRDVTAITVVCNTVDLFQRMHESFRAFHPDMSLIIIDNSDPDGRWLSSENNTHVYHPGKNIGHGLGLNLALSKTITPYALIMDTDIVILKDPLPEMLALMDNSTYGAGCITQVGRDGYDYMAFTHHKNPIPYLHPFFALINVAQFKRHKPFVHHGAPWYKAAVQLYDMGMSDKIKHFNGLIAFDHAPDGTLIAAGTEYVFHDFGGTRKYNKLIGREEIELGWTF